MEEEGGALFGLAFEADRAVVSFDNFAHKGESEPSAFFARSEEGFEDFFVSFVGDPGTLILDGEEEVLFLLGHVEGDGRVGRGSLNGIFEEVEEDLLHTVAVKGHFFDVVIGEALEIELFFVGFGHHQHSDFGDKITPVCGCNIKGGGAGIIEEVVDHIGQVVKFTANAFDVAHFFFVASEFFVEDAAKEFHAPEGVSYFVGDAREHHLHLLVAGEDILAHFIHGFGEEANFITPAVGDGLGQFALSDIFGGLDELSYG